MGHFSQDFRYALRQIRKAPGFALAAICTLALAIGATTAIFSLVDGVLLKPLAYRESNRLVAIWEHVPFLEHLMPSIGPNPRHAAQWRGSQTAFTDLSILNEGTTGVALSGDHPRYVGRVNAEPNLLRVLGVQPALGRDFLPEEGRNGAADRVLISWALWNDLFAARPDVLGQSLLVAGTPMQIIGVLPKDFYFPKSNELNSVANSQQTPSVDVITPTQIVPTDFGWNSDYGNYVVIGRLRPSVTLQQAKQQLDGANAQIAREAPAGQFDPGPQGAVTTAVVPLKDAVVGRSTAGLWLLLGAVGSMLLIACINLANAQLARVMAREQEAALRAALGATAWNLVQSSVLESLILAAAGGGLGIVLAYASLVRSAALVQVAIPRAGNISLNPTVLVVAIACTTMATVLFGALPALRYLRIRPHGALGNGAHATNSARGTNLRRVLIGAQVLACTTLLLLTTLFARNLLQLLYGANGFATGGTILANVRLQGKAFNHARTAAFDEAVLDRLRQLPQVDSVALVSSILSEGQLWVDGLEVAGAPKQGNPLAQLRWISPGYFNTMHQEILAGRAIEERDRVPVSPDDTATGTPAQPTSAVLSETAAKAMWPGQDPLNRTFVRHDHTYIVVGVAADARSNSPREAPVSMVFLPLWDNPPSHTFFLVHTAGDPAKLAPAVRSAIWSYDGGVTIAGVGPLNDTLSDSLAPERLQTILLAAFAGVTLLLALLGIYGTLNYSAGRRTREFGIRMALGATRTNVYWITLNEVLLPIVAGLLAALIAAFALARVLRSLLTISPHIGMASSAAVVSLLLVTALLASFVPCRHAAQVEPMEALRAD